MPTRVMSTSPLRFVIISSTHLNLEQVVTTNALVVHLVVSIVGITTALVLNEGKPMALSAQKPERAKVN